MNAKVSIVIPAYNEEARIAETLKAYTDFSKKSKRKGLKIELIAVCDGCTDRTAKIVRRFRGVKLLEFENRLGKGGGVIAGFNAANGDFLGFADADNSITPEEFGKLIAEVMNGSGCAVASRRIAGSRVIETRGALQKFGSFGLNALACSIFGLSIHDTQCGAKVFRRDVIEKILPLMRSTGFEFDVEMLWRIKNAGYSIKEVPIVWRGKPNSRFSMSECPKMFYSLLLRRIGR